MKDFRIGYLYSLAPIHCGGEGDLGNILEIAREVHTNFPYVPGSSFRGSLRDEVKLLDANAADILFGRELDAQGQMGVHQVWFGDARLLWIPMRTMSLRGGTDIFTWVSCNSLIRDRAIASGKQFVTFPNRPVGTRAGTYVVADAQIEVSAMSDQQKQAIALSENWPSSLQDSVKPTWEQNQIVLPDADFQVLMEHSLWTQIRNKIQDETKGANQAGSAEGFWTDVCIPRDTILYFTWGYRLLKENPVTSSKHDLMMEVLQGLLQVGGQANVGRGWVQSWVSDNTFQPAVSESTATPVGV
ncbi:type III-B CRISPR module RAMP protein Cmr4 [Argonema galeatum]|uniref:type III-B CRISPR module RAMP protein Cmr4 n=1 Tax=Argonema galeatum TaxID=2942762 RepID=UPI002013B9F8|nr:type III-B CRISPR module RAMP protein Cmr4 [Argonema galeatum]MCL1463262.1 type III-B CRISPR module RAMP protein Cmr4 [Argonema galeatum A003/A1]